MVRGISGSSGNFSAPNSNPPDPVISTGFSSATGQPVPIISGIPLPTEFRNDELYIEGSDKRIHRLILEPNNSFVMDPASTNSIAASAHPVCVWYGKQWVHADSSDKSIWATDNQGIAWPVHEASATFDDGYGNTLSVSNDPNIDQMVMKIN